MRILLAGEQRALPNSLVTVLKRSHYAVDVVFGGHDAMDYVLTGLYDLMILDFSTPESVGISVVKEARAKGVLIPIIVLADDNGVSDKVLALDSGADDYVTKPFETSELLARIRAVARRKVALPDDALQFGNMTLSRLTYEIKSGERCLKLGNKEFQIMETFLENPQNVISAEQLIAKIWGYDSDARLSVVWVYVSALRKKMASIGANVRIKANRNIGYYLEKTDEQQ